MDAEEYAVISALINQQGAPEKSDYTLVIKDKTDGWTGFGSSENPDAFYDDLKKSHDLLPEMVDDLKAKNSQPCRLKPHLDIKVKYILVSAEEIDGFFKKGGVDNGWKSFYEKYPKSGGFQTFSRVGFNADKTQALVYHSTGCGGLCGEGSYILFTKKGPRWVEGHSVGPSWIS